MDRQRISDEERAARHRRLKIILAVAVGLVVVVGGFGVYVDRRASDAQSNLRARLREAAQELEHEAVLAEWYAFLGNRDTRHTFEELPSEDRIAVRAEGETVIAVYKAGFAGEDRCFDLVVSSATTKINERPC